jgi:RHS repeat-associated protein
LNTATSAVLSQYVYGYDPAGNRTSEQIGLGVTATAVNNLNQITSSGAGGPLQFTGTLSKPAQVTVGGNTATTGYSTNFAGNANVTTGTNTVPVVAQDVDGNAATNNYQVVVPTGTSVTPSYDSDGNLTNNGNGQTYTWDARNELLSITYASGATSSFTYDGLGRRVKIVEKNSSGTVTSTKQFVWIGSKMAEERDASNNVTKRFFAQGEQISGTAYYYTRDHLGSIREMVDNSGNIQARYDYDPYGRPTKISGSMDSDFQYAGYYEHAPSSLNLTLFRAYDPGTARWLSRDPTGENGGIDLYGYVLNNPLDNIDPLGLDNLNLFAPGSSYFNQANAFGESSNYYTVGAHGNTGSTRSTAAPARPTPRATAVRSISIITATTWSAMSSPSAKVIRAG